MLSIADDTDELLFAVKLLSSVDSAVAADWVYALCVVLAMSAPTYAAVESVVSKSPTGMVNVSPVITALAVMVPDM